MTETENKLSPKTGGKVLAMVIKQMPERKRRPRAEDAEILHLWQAPFGFSAGFLLGVTSGFLAGVTVTMLVYGWGMFR